MSRLQDARAKEHMFNTCNLYMISSILHETYGCLHSMTNHKICFYCFQTDEGCEAKTFKIKSRLQVYVFMKKYV